MKAAAASCSALLAATAQLAAGLPSLVDLVFEEHGPASEWTVSEGVETPYKVIKKEFYSQPLPLLPGQMLFSNPAKTRVPHPTEANFAVLGIRGDVAKELPDGSRVAAPLDEVYDHHWIIEDPYHRNELCPYGPNYIFGIGAESRNTDYDYPPGYGYVFDKNDFWGANIHLLRTDGGSILAGDNSWRAEKECNECYYDPSGSKGPRCTLQNNGTFQCCGDSCYSGACFCPLKKDVLMDPITYYLRYTLTYTYDVAAVKPVKVGTITTPSCKAFYHVYHNEEEPESLSSQTFTVPKDGEILFSVGHLHTGGINISTFHNGERICTSHAKYGSQKGVAGDELGHLVKMTPCYDASEHGGKAYKVKRGDEIRLDAYYWVAEHDPRIAPAPGGTHLNVMAYMYTVYTGISDQEIVESQSAPTLGCLRTVHKFCAKDIGFPEQCVECTELNRKVMEEGGCEGDEAPSVCLNGMSALQNMHGMVPDVLV
eukprot:TRINITY_DN102193_c0_g1_i1.p1 TRINITY_DN102193_c0_g1~~TRINITY_DN102193_c0_g1_i1.p1  ORF type:complete len:483 (+),score=103.31 TRINITY_DN102193_c0_g1_i1:75-1523(+)